MKNVGKRNDSNENNSKSQNDSKRLDKTDGNRNINSSGGIPSTAALNVTSKLPHTKATPSKIYSNNNNNNNNNSQPHTNIPDNQPRTANKPSEKNAHNTSPMFDLIRKMNRFLIKGKNWEFMQEL